MRKVFERVGRFLDTRLMQPLRRLGQFLTHNKVLHVDHHRLRLFNRFNVPITNRRRESVIGLTFIFIWIVGYLIFALYPIFNTLYLSMFKVYFDAAEASGLRLEFQGINNYRAAFLSDPFFVQILIRYVLRLLLNVPVTIVFALVIAMLINQNIRGKGFWRTVFFFPVIISSGPVIGELMNQGATTLPSINDYRFIDLILANVGDFLANPIEALFNEILLVLWFAGIQILILLAGLQKIDKEVYEASMIDGASPWESFWKITLPSIMPLISISVVFTVVSMSVFSLNEVIVYIRNIILTESTPALTTGYGYSATLSWIYFVVMSLIILLFVGLISWRRKVTE
ncbi:MAG: sugar ABC transporter permease [Acholeplasmatales bacterium]|nr:MAG: sugar ABC transporter permease [Acholeplasmatales bacterium]